MSGRRARALRRAAGRPFRHPQKTPTPVELRSHSWREREHVDEKGKRQHQIRPTQLAVKLYGFKDLGWAKRSTYWTLNGKLRRQVQP